MNYYYSKSSIVNKLIFSLFVLLFFFKVSLYSQINNPAAKKHFHVIFFQNGEKVSCIDPSLDVVIKIIDLKDQVFEDHKFYFSYHTGIEGQSILVPPFEEDEDFIHFVSEFTLEDGIFDDKNSQLGSHLNYSVILFDSYGLILREENFQIPFCIDKLNESVVTYERETLDNDCLNCEYKIFSTSGQLVRSFLNNELNCLNCDLGLPSGIYFLFKKDKNISTFERRIFQK